MWIDKALSEAVHLPLNSCSRYIIISDCHRGEGGANDNFLRNQHLYMAALNYYIAHGFTYFELGDGEELWENRHLSRIERVIRMSTAGLKHCRTVPDIPHLRKSQYGNERHVRGSNDLR